MLLRYCATLILGLSMLGLGACGSSSEDDGDDLQAILLALLLESQPPGADDPNSYVFLTQANDWDVEGSISSDSQASYPDWPSNLDWEAFRGDLEDALPGFLNANLSTVQNASEAEQAIDNAIAALHGGTFTTVWTFSTRDDGQTLVINFDDSSGITFPTLNNSFNGQVLGVNQARREELSGERHERLRLQGQGLFNPNNLRVSGSQLTWQWSLTLREGESYPADGGGTEELEEDLTLTITFIIKNFVATGTPSGSG